MPDVLTAVIDSTVLVSAFLTEGGVSAELLRYAREGVFLVFLSEDILAGTEYTLAYDLSVRGITIRMQMSRTFSTDSSLLPLSLMTSPTSQWFAIPMTIW